MRLSSARISKKRGIKRIFFKCLYTVITDVDYSSHPFKEGGPQAELLDYSCRDYDK